MVHVIPYDHAPTVVSARMVQKDPSIPWRVQVIARDVDNATWDPNLFARVDFDADGVFDTDWAYMGPGEGGEWYGEAEIPGVAAGTYPDAVVEVRDGFWARNRMTVALTVP
jgi:hypothetical protein